MSQVSDYNIANASGASVRSDLNAVFDAIKTLNSGGTDPTNPEAFMPYVDTADNNNLKIRNAANNGFTTVGSVNEANLGLLLRSGGTMTGQVLGDDGSGSGSPAFAFDGDEDTGMFRSGPNTIGFSTAGTARVSISDTGLDITNGLPLRLQDSSGAPFVALKSPSTLSSNVTLTLPSNDGNSGDFLQTDGSGALSFSAVQGVPRGSVFCIAHTSVPSGYLECNGNALPNGTGTVQGVTANFAPLRALIGASLPDLRGEFIRGFDNGRGVDSGRNMLSFQNSANDRHTHTASTTTTIPDHDHKVDTNNEFGNQFGVWSTSGGLRHDQRGGTPQKPRTSDTSLSATSTTSISNQGNAGGSRPRNVSMMYIIKF